jgi:hypothetical protein
MVERVTPPGAEEWEEPRVVDMHFPDRDGGLSMRIKHSVIPLMAEQLAGLLRYPGASNYIVQGFDHPEMGRIDVTIQRVSGKTPAEKVMEMRAAIEQIQELAAEMGFADTLGFEEARERILEITGAALAPSPEAESAAKREIAEAEAGS